MPEAEPDPDTIRWYFRIGLGACIAVAITFFIYGTAALDTVAVRAAQACDVSTQSPSSSCLSQFEGVVTEQTPRYRAPTMLTIAVAGTTVHVGWSCLDLSTSVCRATTFPPGTHVITEWWRGRVIKLGVSGAQPLVFTEANPEHDAATRAAYLIIALLALIPLLLAGLLRQAPMSVSKLIDSFFALVPDRTGPASRATIWRVAMGAWGWFGFAIWFALYFLYFFFTGSSTQYTLDAPLAWLVAGLIGFALAGLAGYLYLSHLVQTSKREAVVVQRVKRGTGRGNATQVWYGLPDGTAGSAYLGGEWSHLGHKGLQIDALTDPRSGKVRRILGKAPTQP